MTNLYESPLSGRYASRYMLHLFSADMRYSTWRRLWVSLAKAEHTLGLPVTDDQIAEMEAHIEDIDYECVAAREKEGDDRLIYELAKNNCDCEYAEKKDLPAIYALLKKRYKCVVIMGAGDIQRFLSDKKRDEQREFPDRMSAKS